MNRPPRDRPFVLFEDARPSSGGGRMFEAPSATIAAFTLDDVEPALEAVRQGLKRGLHAAGWLSYEAGFALEQRLRRRAADRRYRLPLLWFGLFDSVTELSRQDIEAALPDGDGAWLSAPRPRMSRAAYQSAFDCAKNFIVAGDVYQINLSYRADITMLGDPMAAYAKLRTTGGGGWSAVAYTGADWLLSTSPELFFRVSNGAIEARPMKGTAKRQDNPAGDQQAAEALKRDPKEIAENLMIVDLLRNDISRIAKRGSVHVPDLFTVETYPTLHTLTSTVRAEIRESFDALDALAALFPCGSITGAPKIRAMEIIDDLEMDQRGAYTGAMGWMSPDGDAAFNVAIRTIVRSANGGTELGLGSAVVFDSSADSEWEECRSKGAFVTANAPAFDLIETMRFEPGVGIELLDLHLVRLERSARTFEFVFDAGVVRAALATALAAASAACMVRMTLSRTGELAFEFKPLPPAPDEPVLVGLLPLPVEPEDFRLRHKTTLRDFYDAARAEAGGYDVIFVGADGLVTEGSFTNVFVERDGALITPAARLGLLPGVLRESLLRSGRAAEGDIRPVDLQAGFFIGNAVRGLLPARLACGGARPTDV